MENAYLLLLFSFCFAYFLFLFIYFLFIHGLFLYQGFYKTIMPKNVVGYPIC